MQIRTPRGRRVHSMNNPCHQPRGVRGKGRGDHRRPEQPPRHRAAGEKIVGVILLGVALDEPTNQEVKYERTGHDRPVENRETHVPSTMVGIGAIGKAELHSPSGLPHSSRRCDGSVPAREQFLWPVGTLVLGTTGVWRHH